MNRVLDWCPGNKPSNICFQCGNASEYLRIFAAKMVRLVENDAIPCETIKAILWSARVGVWLWVCRGRYTYIATNHMPICCDDDGCFCQCFVGDFSLFGAVVNERFMPSIFENLLLPLFYKSDGQDDQCSRLEVRNNKTNHHYCFSEAHFIGDDASACFAGVMMRRNLVAKTKSNSFCLILFLFKVCCCEKVVKI